MGFNKAVFASRLRGKRGERGLSQADVAKGIGVSVSTVHQYENEIATPGADKVYALADTLGCDPGYLLGWKE